jgi:hypothetical protein
VSISVNGTHRFTQTQKNVLIGITGGFGTASGISWTVAEACTLAIITGPVCTAPAGLIAALTATVAAASGTLLAIDPIDLNYTVIPIPSPPSFTPVTAGNGLSQADADAFNAVLTNEAQMVGVLRATITSVNRASGAESVGNTFWAAKQTNAISGFMVQFGGLLTQEANLRGTLVTTLNADNFPAVTITPDEVLSFESNLAFNDWSPLQLSFLQEIGDDRAFIEAMRPLIFTQDINTVAGVIPAAFANQQLITTLRNGGQTLAPFAGTPGAANCHGVSISALAAQYGGISDAATALGFGSVQDLQSAVKTFCGS